MKYQVYFAGPATSVASHAYVDSNTPPNYDSNSGMFKIGDAYFSKSFVLAIVPVGSS